jgi:putative addiction module component (TIGR02574 family)
MNEYFSAMPLSLDQLAKEALQLPPALRAELAEKLVGSLDFPNTDAEQASWAAEAVRRRDEIRSGKVMPIPGEDVVAEVRRLVGR